MRIVFVLAASAVVIAALVLYGRRRSIRSNNSIKRHFLRLAPQLALQPTEDSYFLQLAGEWKGTRVWICPHNFEGPGSITLVYADSGAPYIDRTWIEPTLSMERAVSARKNGQNFGHEVTGKQSFFSDTLRSEMLQAQRRYAYVAVTLPTRFLYSPLLIQALQSCTNFVVFLALDDGRKPSVTAVKTALDDAVRIGQLVGKAL